MTNFTLEDYQDLLAKVKSGKVKIDDDPTGAETKTYSNVNLDYIQ